MLEPLQPGQDVRMYLARGGLPEPVDSQIARVLLANGRIDALALTSLANEAIANNRTLAQAALDSRLVSSEEIFQARAQVNSMETVELSEDMIELDLTTMIDSQIAKDLQAMPYTRDDLVRLVVAVSDPESVALKDQVRALFPKEEIIFHLCEANTLAAYIEKIYDPSRDDLLDTLAQDDDESSEDYVVEADSSGSMVINFVNKIIAQAREKEASDIHVETRADRTLIRFRIDGHLRDIIEAKKKDAEQIIARIKHMSKMRAEERRVSQDGSISIPATRDRGALDLRVVTLPVVHGEEVIMRLLDADKAMTPLADLGMSPINLERYMDAIRKPQGIAIITGPTGSGKSTTLYASIREVIKPTLKVITIEDPVEFKFEGLSQIDVSGGALVSGDESKKMTFPSALKAVLRADPDICMVGEVRDPETASAAVKLAMTGHFIYSTLHTNDAIESFIRLEDMGVNPNLIINTVEVIVAQRLIRKVCQSCREQQVIDAEIAERINLPENVIAWIKTNGPKTFFKAHNGGCATCEGEGYAGRTGIHEVIRMTPELREAVLRGKMKSEIEAIARQQGMASLYDDAISRAWEGITTIEEAQRVASA